MKKIKEFVKKMFGITCWHKWREIKRTDWLIDEKCEKCGNSALRNNF